MQNLQDKTIKELPKGCRTVEDVHEMFKNLFKDTLLQVFEAELVGHLGYKKHNTEGLILGIVEMVIVKNIKTNY